MIKVKCVTEHLKVKYCNAAWIPNLFVWYRLICHIIMICKI